MSADNGIYVLETPTKNGAEYRVAHCFSIDDLNYFEPDTKEAHAMEVFLFGESPVYNNAHDAMKAAIILHNDVKYTEYGICCLNVRNNPFPTISLEDAKNILNAA